VLTEETQIIHRLLHSTDNFAREVYDRRVRPRGSLLALPNAVSPEWPSGDFDRPLAIDVNMYLR
jgi:hypothetical protein